MVAHAIVRAPGPRFKPPLRGWAGEEHDNPSLHSQAGTARPVPFEVNAAQRIGVLDAAEEI